MIELNPTTIAAIMAWVRAGSSVTAVWAQQDGPPVARPYIEVGRPSVDEARGLGWVDVEDNPTPSAGAEILQVARQPVVIRVRLQCFATDPIEDDATSAACAILSTLARKSKLPTMQDALRAANLGIMRIGGVQSTGGVVNSANFEPRAVLEVAFHGAAEVSETGTYVETVETDGEVNH